MANMGHNRTVSVDGRQAFQGKSDGSVLHAMRALGPVPVLPLLYVRVDIASRRYTLGV